ncbi:hypothetical protein O5P60_004861 [Vibrio parahaemolyticus]|nr:hypothetical protein [Vibrio parahaemolyticus]EKG9665975.1 hypothetical protein [Vibrio parahaemolyticus]EKG9671121.1 hypothetical protein [Vibrio parahaemolyticus]
MFLSKLGDKISVDNCFYDICFEAINMKAGKFFGFSEYLASLAIMVLAWNIVDIRYKFRLYVAPFNLKNTSFYIMSFIGLFCVLMEVWLLKGFPVIKNSPVTFEDLQIILALTYLSVFVLWIRFTFIQPSKFGRRNADRYVGYVGNIFISRNADSISIILDEILYSINEIMELASEKDKQNINDSEKYANTLIALISDKLICEIMVDKHPILFNKIYELAYKNKKFNMDLNLFAMNFITCALDNRESFVYRESDDFSSSYLSIFKPVCSGVYDNYKIINN